MNHMQNAIRVIRGVPLSGEQGRMISKDEYLGGVTDEVQDFIDGEE